MPSEPAELVQVEYTPEFKRNLRALAKKYHHIRSDVQPVIDQPIDMAYTPLEAEKRELAAR